MSAQLALRFLGVGNASARQLGSSSAVLECDAEPLLLIDVGPDVLQRYLERYGALPAAAFITHAHGDHIGDLEAWFYRLAFASESLPKLYLPAPLVPLLQRRIADFPNWVAEGGHNFWDVFQLIPVSADFWHGDWRFRVFPVRHHAPDSAFGLALPGSFVYSGDTRPVPEQIRNHAGDQALVFHDCAPQPNPSHTGLAEIDRDYGTKWHHRLVLYHYPDSASAERYRAAGYTAAQIGQAYPLPNPEASCSREAVAAWSAG